MKHKKNPAFEGGISISLFFRLDINSGNALL